MGDEPASEQEIDDALHELGLDADRQAIELRHKTRNVGTDELYVLAARNYYEAIGKEPISGKIHRKHAGVLLGIFMQLTDRTLIDLHQRYAAGATKELDTWPSVSGRMVQLAVHRKRLDAHAHPSRILTPN